MINSLQAQFPRSSVSGGNLGSALASPVDYEVRVPSSAFAEGNTIIPEAAAARVARLNDFEKLFSGRFDDFLDARDVVVRVNMFRKSAVWLADELMSNPPEIEVAEGEHLTTPRFRESLLDNLHNVLVDYNRFGAGLFHIRLAAGGRWECVAPLPMSWYPISDSATAFVSNLGDGNLQVVIDNGGGQVDTRFFVRDEDKFGVEIPAADGQTPEAQIGNELSWGVLADSSVGRTSLFIPVRRRPVTGDWGLSLYADAWSLIFESMRRLSQMSSGLESFGDLKYTLERAPDGYSVDKARQGFEQSLDGKTVRGRIARATAKPRVHRPVDQPRAYRPRPTAWLQPDRKPATSDRLLPAHQSIPACARRNCRGD